MSSVFKIGNIGVDTLKEKYNTPLYVYDEEKIIKNITDLKDNFKSNKYKTEVIFASKSFNVKHMLRLTKEYDLGVDCVSYGELYTAKAVMYDSSKIYIHGNNKSYDELITCINDEINIVVDNLDELKLINEIANKSVSLYIRINVGVDAHTHKYIVTSHIDSKFGVIYNSEDYLEMMNIIKSNSLLNFKGFHAHIGSQIFDISAFKAEIDKLISLCCDFDKPLDIDLGGGFGVKYTNEDKPIALDVVAKTIINYVDEALDNYNVSINKLMIEPGRSVVAEAGYTIYTIGSIKKTPNRLYYFIDGGMTDNIRVALYQAKYDCDVATKMDMDKNVSVCVAGKCCESGDILVENTMLQEAKAGDLMVFYTTGAYGYSMSSNYNKALTPAVVFVNKDNDKLAVKRQTYEELIEREL